MNRVKLVVCAVFGNCFEVYDFIIYQLMSGYISRNFFNPSSGHQFLLTQMVFVLTTILSRPIGALIFGYISDSRGRKSSLEKSILMSALCTGMIGLVPSYETIGVFSTVLLIFFRFLQGISFGGEHGTSVCFLLEHSSPRTKGLLSSCCCLGQQIGMLLATIATSSYSFYVNNFCVNEQLWRIIFIFSFPFGLFAYWIKTDTSETIDFLLGNYYQERPICHISESKLFIAKNKKLILAGFFIVAFGTYINYAVFIIGNRYLLQKQAESLYLFKYIQYIMSFILIFSIPFFGYFSDKIGRKTMLSHSTGMIAALSLPFFQCLQSTSPGYSTLAIIIILTIACGAYFAVAPTIIAEALPVNTRCISYAVFYSIPAAIVSGFAPFVSTWVIGVNPVYLGYVIIILAICSMLSLRSLDEPINLYSKINIYSYEFLKP